MFYLFFSPVILPVRVDFLLAEHSIFYIQIVPICMRNAYNPDTVSRRILFVAPLHIRNSHYCGSLNTEHVHERG